MVKWLSALMLGLGMTAMTPSALAVEGQLMTLTTAYGTQFDAYVAGPEQAPGILLVHDRYGLNPDFIAQADRIAGRGYRVMVPDLFDGRRAADPDRAEILVGQIDPQWTKPNLRTALQALGAKGRQVVVMGWGYGAEQALVATLQDPTQVAGTVLYYGELVTDAAHLRGIKQPVFIVAAARDHQPRQRQVAAFRQSLLLPGTQVAVHRVDAVTGFATPSSPHFDQWLTDRVWAHTETFLKAVLASDSQ